TQKVIWWGLQWVALGITIALLARSFRDQADRNIFLIISIVCFVGSWFWRLHVERGQYYIFSTMLISLDLAMLRTQNSRPRWLVAASGIAVVIKPSNLILLPMLWLAGDRRVTLLAAFAAALVVAASLYPAGPKVWSSFVSVVQSWTEYELDSDFEK